MLVASGFKVITPKTPAQQQKLQNLPPGKMTMIQKKGKTYYIFPDPAHNQAYVGRPRQYQTYLQMRADKKLARKISELLRCTRTLKWNGVSGADGEQALDPLVQRGAQVRIDASRAGRHPLARWLFRKPQDIYLPTVRLGGVLDRLQTNCL
jgi:hypothetical protein